MGEEGGHLEIGVMFRWARAGMTVLNLLGQCSQQLQVQMMLEKGVLEAVAEIVWSHFKEWGSR